jgi:hypothetical protein
MLALISATISFINNKNRRGPNKEMKPLHPPLEMNSQIIQQGTNHKHLGLFFSNNGLWHDHIDYIVKKAYTEYQLLHKD